MAITRVFDKALEPIAIAIGHRPEDLGIAVGTTVITEGIEFVEDAVAKGWWKALLYAFGGLSTLYFSGQSKDPRTKLEGAIIGVNLCADFLKEVLKNRDAVEQSFSTFMDALARGDVESALNTMVKTDAIEGLVSMVAGHNQVVEAVTPVVPEITMTTTPTLTPTQDEAMKVKARG